MNSPPETPPREDGANPCTDEAARATTIKSKDTMRFILKGKFEEVSIEGASGNKVWEIFIVASLKTRRQRVWRVASYPVTSSFI